MGTSEDRHVLTNEERAKALLAQLKSVHALDIGRDMVIAAVNFCYPKLGLSDETRSVRHLEDVRATIELTRAILEVLDREYGDQRTRDLHDTLAQMQLSYAHAVQLANAERAAAGEQTAAETPGSPGDEATAPHAVGDEAAPPTATEPGASDVGPAEVAESPGGEGTPKRRSTEKKQSAKTRPSAGEKPSAKRPSPKARPSTKQKPSTRDGSAGGS